MSHDISNFYGAAVKHDFARQFQFAVTQIGTTDFLNSEQTVYIETASLPGKQINNIPVPYMGLAFNVPGTVSYPGSAGYQVTFRCDQNYAIRSQLEEALKKLFNDFDSKGEYGTPGQSSLLTFVLYDKQRNPIRTYTLFGVWIQSLADAAYNIGDNGAIVQIQATISYQYWRAVQSAGATAPSGLQGAIGTPPFPSGNLAA